MRAHNFTREEILNALSSSNNRHEASAKLNIAISSLYKLMREHSIKRGLIPRKKQSQPKPKVNTMPTIKAADPSPSINDSLTRWLHNLDESLPNYQASDDINVNVNAYKILSQAHNDMSLLIDRVNAIADKIKAHKQSITDGVKASLKQDLSASKIGALLDEADIDKAVDLYFQKHIIKSI